MAGLVADKCSQCGAVRQPGAIFYLVHITLTCDFDGELMDMNSEEIRGKIEEEMQKASEKDEAELMDEVYQELYFYLCKSCRDRFVQKLRAQES
jgi:hypothetical protein